MVKPEFLPVLSLLGPCDSLMYYNSVSNDDEKSKFFVIKRIFMLSFLVSMMTFGCTIIAIGAAV